MDSTAASNSLLNTILPIATLLVGYATKALSDWIDSRRASERERESRRELRRDQILDRRTTFQRETLLELQDVIMEVVRAASAAHIAQVKTSMDWKEWQKEPQYLELSEQGRVARARGTVLATRVRDEQIFALIDDIKLVAAAIVRAETMEESRERFIAMTTLFEKFNQRARIVLKGLDDELLLQDSAV